MAWDANAYVMPRSSWSRSALISYAERTESVGMKLRQIMKAASLLVGGPIDDAHSEEAKEWSRRHSEYFASPLYGSMVLHNKQWTIFCGNDCSSRLTTSLPLVPQDKAAALAFLELRKELQRLHENPA
jgi:hypothetical protein